MLAAACGAPESLFAQSTAPRVDRLVARAQAWITARYDAAKGGWPASLSSSRHRAGIESLAAWALLHGPADAARSAQSALQAADAALPGSGDAEYAKLAWCLAALELVGRTREANDTRRELRARIAHRIRSALRSKSFEARETCFAALALIAAKRASERGVAVDRERVAGLLELVTGRAIKSTGEFNSHEFPSRGYGATALACEALLLHGRGDSPACRAGIRWLESQGVADLVAQIPAPTRGPVYLRGRKLFELRAHLSALRLAKSKQRERVVRRIAAGFAARVHQDGSFPGEYGKLYGSALLVLCLRTE